MRIALTAAFFFLLACADAVDPKGELVPMSQLREALKPRGKPLLVNHWASWCKPCIDELPALAALARRYEGKVDFLGVSWDLLAGSANFEEARSKAEAAARKAGIPYDSLIPEGTPEALGETLGLEGLQVPQTFLFDREGKKVAEFEPIEDEKDERTLELAFDKLLK